MTAVSIPPFVSHGGALPVAAATPVDRSPQVMHQLRFPFEATAVPATAGDAGKVA